MVESGEFFGGGGVMKKFDIEQLKKSLHALNRDHLKIANRKISTESLKLIVALLNTHPEIKALELSGCGL